MFFLVFTDLIDPKEAPKSVKSLGMVFFILMLGHIDFQGAVFPSSLFSPKLKCQRRPALIGFQKIVLFCKRKQNSFPTTKVFIKQECRSNRSNIPESSIGPDFINRKVPTTSDRSGEKATFQCDFSMNLSTSKCFPVPTSFLCNRKCILLGILKVC